MNAFVSPRISIWRGHFLACLFFMGVAVPGEKIASADCRVLEQRVKAVSAKLKRAKRIADSGRRSRVTKKLKKVLRKSRASLAICRLTPPAPAVVLEFVRVGNPGNADDPSDGDVSTAMVIEQFGAVSSEYGIGKYEVTVGQYTTFLNAVADEDTHGLYSDQMAVNLNIAGIARSGAPGSYTYSVIGSPDKPVTFVSWFDAARFCNWLHNGTPEGAQDATTTETGAYSLNGATSNVGFDREPGALFFLPSEDEWYKAAYFDPRSLAEGGPGDQGDDNYWVYPSQNDFNPPAGNLIGSDPHQVNFRIQGTNFYSVTQAFEYDSDQNYLTNVGSYTGTPGFYGTFDMGGNVREWTGGTLAGGKVIRGGSWDNAEGPLRAGTRQSETPESQTNNLGFRVATP